MMLTLDYQLIFPDLNVWTALHWVNDRFSAKWACWEFLGFIIGWLGKVPFCLSCCGLANWLIWPSSLCMFAWGNLDFSCAFPYFSQNQSFSFQVEDSGRKMVELGWESFVDNLKNCCENCEGILESSVDDWKNYWNDGSGLHGSKVGIVVLAPWEIWVIFPARIVRWA